MVLGHREISHSDWQYDNIIILSTFSMIIRKEIEGFLGGKESLGRHCFACTGYDTFTNTDTSTGISYLNNTTGS